MRGILFYTDYIPRKCQDRDRDQLILGQLGTHHIIRVGSNFLGNDIPISTILLTHVVLMLAHRLRRWPNIKTTWFQLLLFVGKAHRNEKAGRFQLDTFISHDFHEIVQD